MNALGIHTGLDLRRQTQTFLTRHFGKAGDFYYGIARGEDDRPVNPERVAKSIGAEATFERDLEKWEEVEPAMTPLFAKVWEAYTKAGFSGGPLPSNLSSPAFVRSRVADLWNSQLRPGPCWRQQVLICCARIFRLD